MEAKTIDLTGVGRGIEVPGVQKGKEERVDTRLDVETGMGSTVVQYHRVTVANNSL